MAKKATRTNRRVSGKRTLKIRKATRKTAKVIVIPAHTEFEISLDTLVRAMRDQITDQELRLTAIARKAKLCVGSVYGLLSKKNGRTTKSPHLRTVWGICRALGWNTMEMSLNPDVRRSRFTKRAA